MRLDCRHPPCHLSQQHRRSPNHPPDQSRSAADVVQAAASNRVRRLMPTSNASSRQSPSIPVLPSRYPFLCTRNLSVSREGVAGLTMVHLLSNNSSFVHCQLIFPSFARSFQGKV